MLNVKKLSDEEQKLLGEIAKAKGKSLEEMLLELGHSINENVETTKEDSIVETTKVETADDTLGNLPENEKNPVEEQVNFPTASDTVSAAEPPIAAEEEIVVNSEQKMATARNVCNHCGWDQANPVIPEPEANDKLIFLQAIIGQKVFSKRYSLFDGNLRVTFRSLTVKEIDSLYSEAFKAQKAGVIETASDYYEYLNRQRLFLQLVGLSSNNSALHITLPDGYTRETNSTANTYWDEFLIKNKLWSDEDSTNQSLMLKVQDYILTHVLKTEHLQRVVNLTCINFNKLVAKLEANVDNENFWKATGPLT